MEPRLHVVSPLTFFIFSVLNSSFVKSKIVTFPAIEIFENTKVLNNMIKKFIFIKNIYLLCDKKTTFEHTLNNLRSIFEVKNRE